ncbi:hypothetical protein Rsub_04389 [Raphidocelis subcapitata]|uniref:Uncharacterized protein n=1 Tax=Raphidocelis subcapitata TaxID=307507 RepID=A0A2V0NZE1_9CHLO|nr:hypothetical protein Rsub_04389 [Raphidocelis subcapitata]|eukprot:GBF92042.1 hypothetical protein Rsub_04389 [Raphidocelis subcapitata]
MLAFRSVGCGSGPQRGGPRRTRAAAPAAAAAARCRCAAPPPRLRRAAALPPGKAEEGAKGGDSDEEFEGLLPEEDVEVPGTYFDALNRNTRLGKAVAAAVDELEHLNKMELDSLAQADELLKKLGLKSSLFGEAGKPPPLKGGGKAEDGGAGEDS